MHRDHESAANVAVRPDPILGSHVDIGPALAVRAHLNKGRVEGSVLGADPSEPVEVPGVAGVEDLATSPGRWWRSGDHPGSPQRSITAEPSAGEVTRGCDREAHLG